MLISVHTFHQRKRCKEITNGYAQITVLARNYRVKPVIGLSNMLTYSFMNYNSNTQKDSDLNATTSVEMPGILIGTNSTQDVQQDLVLLSIIEGMKNE